MDLLSTQYDERCRQIIHEGREELEDILRTTDAGERRRKLLQHVLALHARMQEEMDCILSVSPQYATELELILFARLNKYKAVQLRWFAKA